MSFNVLQAINPACGKYGSAFKYYHTNDPNVIEIKKNMISCFGTTSKLIYGFAIVISIIAIIIFIVRKSSNSNESIKKYCIAFGVSLFLCGMTFISIYLKTKTFDQENESFTAYVGELKNGENFNSTWYDAKRAAYKAIKDKEKDQAIASETARAATANAAANWGQLLSGRFK